MLRSALAASDGAGGWAGSDCPSLGVVSATLSLKRAADLRRTSSCFLLGVLLEAGEEANYQPIYTHPAECEPTERPRQC